MCVLGLAMMVPGAPAFSPPPAGQLLAGGPGPVEHDWLAMTKRNPHLNPTWVSPFAFPALRQAGAARGVACNAKANKVDREDPEYKAVLARQQVLTEAMDVLTKYDEAQTDFQALYADSNAPLGDWCGYYTRLTADKRETMRDSCRALASEASYVLIGLNAGNLVEARNAMGQWITGLGLPEPDRVPFTDDTLRQEYDAIDEMPDELQELFSGPIHMCYNSIAGADEDTGDDAGPKYAPHPFLPVECRRIRHATQSRNLCRLSACRTCYALPRRRPRRCLHAHPRRILYPVRRYSARPV